MAITGTVKIIFVALVALTSYTKADSKVVCYYNSIGRFPFPFTFLEPAMQFCTHLVYGYAVINPDNFSMGPHPERDNYRHITDLKKRFPGLKVLLSVGGDRDVWRYSTEKNVYITVIESVGNRLAFINSAKDLVQNYGFDGLDLAWEFPKTEPKKIPSSFSKLKSVFIGIVHEYVGKFNNDEEAEEHEEHKEHKEHKEQFTALVREIKNNFTHNGLLLTLSVLPNVNSDEYYDVRQIAPHIDFVTLQAFDFYTPNRNPKESDYTAPLYEPIGRTYDQNADYQVRYWLKNGCPENKILLGIPTYGHIWPMDIDSGLTGVPPLTVDGPGIRHGSYTYYPGLLSYAEICSGIATPNEIAAGDSEKLRKVNDPTRRYGTYAFRLPKDGKVGLWVSFEDGDTAGKKASYVKAKGLGGIAIIDLNLDDFLGVCTGDKYPLLRSAKNRL